tara:strand:+ start:276 stop:1508 length:1233 start_codon:yes stop_codon:yes gene_type:complete
MFLSVLLLIVAVIISAVAAYYSIAGLITIFAAAVVPVIVMASVLEFAKVLTAAWLSHNWKRINFFLKSYLTFAVIVLMLITSLGIFGFLSKAHIQQTADAKENVAQIEIVTDNIERKENEISDWQDEIVKIENSGLEKNTEINEQITIEETRLKDAVKEYEGLVSEQKELIQESRKNLNLVDKYTAENNITALQTLVGSPADGKYGKQTARKVVEYTEQEQNRVDILVSNARNRINELRDEQRNERVKSNELIDRLRSEISLDDIGVGDKQRIEFLKKKIDVAYAVLQDMNLEKMKFEKMYREIETEVGPIKYVAEILYSEVDEGVLEDAVRFIILCLIFVFDPLAILLVIAGTSSITYYRQLKRGENLTHLSEEDFKKETDIIPTEKKSPTSTIRLKNGIQKKLKTTKI